MSTIKLQKNVPLPEKRSLLPDLPLSRMEVGHSFLMKNVTAKNMNAIRGRVQRYQKSHPPTRFSVQVDPVMETTNVRVFRIEDYEKE